MGPVAGHVRTIERQPADRSRDIGGATEHASIGEDAGADAGADGEQIAPRLAAAPRHVSPRMYAARSLSMVSPMSLPSAVRSSSRSG